MLPAEPFVVHTGAEGVLICGVDDPVAVQSIFPALGFEQVMVAVLRMLMGVWAVVSTPLT